MKKLLLDLRIYLAIAACGWLLSGPALGYSDWGDTNRYANGNHDDRDDQSPPPRKPKSKRATGNRRSKKLVSRIKSGHKLLSLLPSDQRASATRLLDAARNNPDNRSLCGSQISFSSNSPQEVADGQYRWLAQQLNCNSKLPSVKNLSLVSKLPDGMCCIFDGGWDRNGGHLVRGQKFYGDASSLSQPERQCGQNRGRWFTWNGDILTNTTPEDNYPYGRKIATAGGDIWEPVDYAGYNGEAWLATAEPECPQRTVSPLIVDFGNSEVPLSDQKNGVFFDLTANGTKERISWPVDRRSMFLVLGEKENQIDGGSLFGNYSKGPDGELAGNGFLALAKYDANGDGKVDAADPVFNQLRLWSDENRNGTIEKGELLSLAETNVRLISLSYADLNRRDEFGNSVVEVGSLTLTNGESRKIYDVWFAVESHLAYNLPTPSPWPLGNYVTAGLNYVLDRARREAPLK